MLKRFFVSLLAALFAFSFAVAACNLKGKEAGLQQLNYEESTAKINNPDQGFYRPIYVRMTESGASYNKNIVTAATRLYHLRIDISAFSAAVNGGSDKDLTSAALDGLNGLLSYLKQSDKNAVVRFAYDPSYNGQKDKEPALSKIIKHIEQVCPILNNYQSTITAIEAGLIGPWGEMHSSAIANAANINPVIEAFLTGTQNIPVLVRTPKMIYNYLGITINDIDELTISSTEKAYRLGMYNDGYLGSGNDLGTYTNREKEIAFLSRHNEHLPYGGEVVIPNSTLHDIENCLPEMYEMNLSYLNVEWNNQVIDKWKNTYYTSACGSDRAYYKKSAFTYIENRLGYRFVLEKSVFKLDENYNELSVKLNLKNVGFGNLNKTKSAKLIIVGEDGAEAVTKQTAVFTGSESYGCSTDLNLQSGKYEVYLRLYGEESEGVPLYCLQFANDGLWNETLKANKIGVIEIP